MTDDTIRRANNTEVLAQILANQQEVVTQRVILHTNIELLLQQNTEQGRRLDKLNSRVEKNQDAIVLNAKAVAVALEKVKSNSDKIAWMWKLLVPLVSAGVVGGTHMAGMW